MQIAIAQLSVVRDSELPTVRSTGSFVCVSAFSNSEQAVLFRSLKRAAHSGIRPRSCPTESKQHGRLACLYPNAVAVRSLVGTTKGTKDVAMKSQYIHNAHASVRRGRFSFAEVWVSLSDVGTYLRSYVASS